MSLKSRLKEGDFEVQRLVEQLKAQKQLVSDYNDRLVMMQSERDFYKIKFSEASPEEYNALQEVEVASESSDDPSVSAHPVVVEKNKTVNVIAEYLKTISQLKNELAESRKLKSDTGNAEYGSDIGGPVVHDSETNALESELTSSVARVIAQAEQQLQMEQKQLTEGSSMSPEKNMDDDNEDNNDEINAVETADKAYLKRQSIMNSEVVELSESILLKEQLLQQLQKS